MITSIEPRQEAFVREYCKDFNGQKAAIRAGYNSKNARFTASRLLTKANVKALLKEIQEEIRQHNRVTIQKVIAENARIAFSDLKDFVQFGPDGVTILDHRNVDSKCVESVEMTQYKIGEITTKTRMKIKLHDKGAALERLGQYLGVKDKGERPPDFQVHFHIGEEEASAIGVEFSIEK